MKIFTYYLLAALLFSSLYASDLGKAELESKIALPYMQGKSKEALLFNEAISKYARQITSKFYEDVLAKKSLDISYEKVPSPFYTVRLDVLEQAGSSYARVKFFHLYKGKLINFADLFTKGYAKIASNIRSQMKLRMRGEAKYKLDFVLKDDQSFYFKGGYLVVVFDAYAVGPGYLGVVQFSIPKSLTKSMLKKEFASF